MREIDFKEWKTPDIETIQKDGLLVDSFRLFFHLFTGKGGVLVLFGALVFAVFFWGLAKIFPIPADVFSMSEQEQQAYLQANIGTFAWIGVIYGLFFTVVYLVFTTAFHRLALRIEGDSAMPLRIGRAELRFVLRVFQAILLMMVIMAMMMFLSLVISRLPVIGPFVAVGLTLVVFFAFVGIWFVMPAAVLGTGYGPLRGYEDSKGLRLRMIGVGIVFTIVTFIAQWLLGLVMAFVGLGFLTSSSDPTRIIEGGVTLPLTIHALWVMVEVILGVCMVSTFFARRHGFALSIDPVGPAPQA